MNEQLRGELPDPTDGPVDEKEFNLEANLAEMYARVEAVIPGIREKLVGMSLDEREQLAKDLDLIVSLDESLPE